MLAAKNLESKAQVIKLSESDGPQKMTCSVCKNELNDIALEFKDDLVLEGLYRVGCTNCKTKNFFKIVRVYDK
jgi:hypothetical protein